MPFSTHDRKRRALFIAMPTIVFVVMAMKGTPSTHPVIARPPVTRPLLVTTLLPLPPPLLTEIVVASGKTAPLSTLTPLPSLYTSRVPP